MEPDSMEPDVIRRLMEIADFTVAFALRAVARVGVADALADGPRDVDDLARATGTHAPSLLRALRALAALFAEPSPGVFALTPMGGLLREDHPMSMRWAFRIHPDVGAWSAMEHTLRTGRPAFEHVYGRTYWEQLALDEEAHRQFRRSQSAMTRREVEPVARAYDWARVSTVVDLGGNDGTFLAALVARFPHLRGTLVDLPGAVVDRPGAVVDRPGAVVDRPGALVDRPGMEAAARAGLVVRAADILRDPLPAGADVYLIKRVLTGFDDTEIRSFAVRVAAAMRPDSRLLIMEPPAGPALDLHMLVLARGSARSPTRFAEVLAPTPLAVTRVVDASVLDIIEVTRRDAR